jgi:hypothetical protein
LAAAEREWLAAANRGHQLARLKLLKYESLHSPFWKKPVLYAKMILLVLKTLPVVLENTSDPRVLGSLR